MRVLWFANTPCGAAIRLDRAKFTGGWLSSLETEITKNAEIDLHVAFYYPDHIESFRYGDVTYHPIFRRDNSFVHRLLNRLDGEMRRNSKNLDSLENVVKEVDPHVIHIHGTEDNFGLLQARVRKNFLISIQGLLTPYVEKYYSGIPRDFVRSVSSVHSRIFGDSYFRAMSLHAKREQTILSKSQNIMGRTDWDRRITRLYSPQSNYYVGDEILRPQFYTYKWAPPIKSKFRIATIMSGGFYKGFETILKASSIMKSAGCDFEWVVIGQDSSDISVKIAENYCNIKSHDVFVRLVGRLDPSGIIEIFADSSCYCQVSHIENSPNSLCEAMLAGLPCVATFAGGTSSLMANDIEGLLVQDGDPYAIAGAIIELRNHPSKATDLGLAAQVRASIRHRPQKIVDQVIASYKCILGQA